MFGGIGDEKKLGFDLARTLEAARRRGVLAGAEAWIVPGPSAREASCSSSQTLLGAARRRLSSLGAHGLGETSVFMAVGKLRGGGRDSVGQDPTAMSAADRIQARRKELQANESVDDLTGGKERPNHRKVRKRKPGVLMLVQDLSLKSDASQDHPTAS